MAALLRACHAQHVQRAEMPGHAVQHQPVKPLRFREMAMLVKAKCLIEQGLQGHCVSRARGSAAVFRYRAGRRGRTGGGMARIPRNLALAPGSHRA